MELRQFGPTKRQVAVIGQGTWEIDRGDRDHAVTALRCGLDLGMNHIDTAEMYGSGTAEKLIAEAISGRSDEVFLVAKVLPRNASRAGTIAACEGSLSRLKTDRLDCYLLHWRGSLPLEDTIAAFETLRRDGKILSWGVSNFDGPILGKHRRSRVRGVWFATRSSTIFKSERLSTPCYPGARRTASPWLRTALSVMNAFRGPVRPAAAC